MRYFVIDAFTDQVFKGNPAGVCLPEEWPADAVMQNIAAENNLSETAFAIKQGDCYKLRWFTPSSEIDLCGHATLATAYTIMRLIEPDARILRFTTLSGLLTVERKDDLYELDFPARKPVPTAVTRLMEQAVKQTVLEAHVSRNLLLLLENEQQVAQLEPDFALVKQLPDVHALIVTARGSRTDFVSRFFAPGIGILEDPVTGSSHTELVPFWAERLGKQKMTAAQLSRRGGILYCENAGDRVKMAGRAALYLEGEIKL